MAKTHTEQPYSIAKHTWYRFFHECSLLPPLVCQCFGWSVRHVFFLSLDVVRVRPFELPYIFLDAFHRRSRDQPLVFRAGCLQFFRPCVFNYFFAVSVLLRPFRRARPPVCSRLDYRCARAFHCFYRVRLSPASSTRFTRRTVCAFSEVIHHRRISALFGESYRGQLQLAVSAVVIAYIVLYIYYYRFTSPSHTNRCGLSFSRVDRGALTHCELPGKFPVSRMSCDNFEESILKKKKNNKKKTVFRTRFSQSLDFSSHYFAEPCFRLNANVQIVQSRFIPLRFSDGRPATGVIFYRSVTHFSSVLCGISRVGGPFGRFPQVLCNLRHAMQSLSSDEHGTLPVQNEYGAGSFRQGLNFAYTAECPPRPVRR